MEAIGLYDGVKNARVAAAKSSAANGQATGQGVQRDAGGVGTGAGLMAGEGMAERDGGVSEGLPSATSTDGRVTSQLARSTTHSLVNPLQLLTRTHLVSAQDRLNAGKNAETVCSAPARQ